MGLKAKKKVVDYFPEVHATTILLGTQTYVDIFITSVLSRLRDLDRM